MNSIMRTVVFGLVATVIAAAGRTEARASSALLSLEPSVPTLVSPGEVVSYDVFLRDYQPDDSSQPIIAFALDVSASDADLTGGGADFSRFSFVLDSALTGIIGGLAFDPDLGDDGRVEFAADLPPFGTEAGIFSSMGDLRLGVISVVAPSSDGTFAVALAVDPAVPANRSYLLIDDGSALGQTLPGDGALSVSNSSLTVQASAVPEPSTWVLGLLGLLGSSSTCRRAFRRRDMNIRTGPPPSFPIRRSSPSIHVDAS